MHNALLHFAFFQALSGSNCGVKSFAAPGTLYSYGARYTIGSVRKLPCPGGDGRSEEHTSELQSRPHLVCRLLLQKKTTRLQAWPAASAVERTREHHLRTTISVR